MKSTNNFGLQKPEPMIDNVNIEVINGNMDTIDTALNNIAKYEAAGGTTTAITLSGIELLDGRAKSFIVATNNNGSATTINGKPLYTPGTATAPMLIAGRAVTIWYNAANDSFYASPCFDADRLGGQLPSYYLNYINFSNKPTSLPAAGGDASTVGGHTVNADVPAGAKFTDTVYTHPTTAGNKHVPAGGAAGQYLKWNAAGEAAWDTITANEAGIIVGTTDLTAGSSALTTGNIYLVYE